MTKHCQAVQPSTEQLEDQFLAGIQEDEDLDISEKLNECIDPDSSALNIFSDEEDKENVQNEAKKTKETETAQVVTKTPSHSSISAVKRTETIHHSPVTAANFYSMGPFFGLPMKVKKLIQTYKNIDDLYGKNHYCLYLFLQSFFP